MPDSVTPRELAIRWQPDEQVALHQLKELLLRPTEDGIALVPVPRRAHSSDRRLIRFLRRYSLDVHQSAEAYRSHLRWRREHDVDRITERIVAEGLTPVDFPLGEQVLELMPQIPCTLTERDRFGNALTVECYDFPPSAVLAIDLVQYLQYHIYSHEYKMLVLDHISTEAEEQVAHASTYQPQTSCLLRASCATQQPQNTPLALTSSPNPCGL